MQRTEAGSTKEGRGAVRTALLLLAPVAVAYAVLWAGGAAEVVTGGGGEPGDTCWVTTAESSGIQGQRVDRWVGGGLLGRPGVVCEAYSEVDGVRVATGPSEPQLTVADALSAVLAVIAFVATSIVVFERRRPERRGPW